MLKANLEDSGPQLTIQRIGCQLIGQLLGIQKCLPKWVGFFLDFGSLGSSGCQKSLDNSRQGCLSRSWILGISANSDSCFNLGRLFPRIGWVRLPDVKRNINPPASHGLSGRLVLVNQGFIVLESPICLYERSVHRVILDPEETVITDILGLNGRRIQRCEITNTNRRPRVKPGSRIQDNRTFVGILFLINLLAIQANSGSCRSIEWRRCLSYNCHIGTMAELED